jgi:hypothetical protein
LLQHWTRVRLKDLQDCLSRSRDTVLIKIEHLLRRWNRWGKKQSIRSEIWKWKEHPAQSQVPRSLQWTGQVVATRVFFVRGACAQHRHRPQATFTASEGPAEVV